MQRLQALLPLDKGVEAQNEVVEDGLYVLG